MDPETSPEAEPPEPQGSSVPWEHLDYNTHEEKEIDFFDRED
jgi:hypothetical protein